MRWFFIALAQETGPLNSRALLPKVLCGLILSGLLSGCVSPELGGPTAPKGAVDAGILTLPSGRSYLVYPEQLAYTGQGLYLWPDGRQYQGGFVAGKPDGMGIATMANGDRYRGSWKDGLQNGHGELNRADGSHYVGDFVSGSREGSGVEQSAEGLYRGAWQNDLPHGSGQFHGIDGAAYEGQWSNGVREGFGSFTDTRGNRYEGDWYDDVPSGFGVMHNANGSVYEGEWHNSRQNGYGRVTTEAGAIYEGTWVNGKRQGFGIATRPDGSRYEGEWLEGNRSGQGKESFADGSYHQGSWEADQPLGEGTRQDRTGITISGLWNADQLDSGLLRLPTGPEYTGRLLKNHNREVHQELLGWLNSLAARNDPYAHFFLGTAYSDFDIPAPARSKATKHFAVAAEAGIPDGQFRLALLIAKESPGRAIELLISAAAADQAQANTLLGQYYLSGNGVPLNVITASRYLRAGSNAGDMTARNNLAWVLATTYETRIRDGAESLALIRPLALLHDDWQHLDTLAAAQAETGDFESAIATQQRAIEKASADPGDTGQSIVAMTNRLSYYRAGKPFRE